MLYPPPPPPPFFSLPFIVGGGGGKSGKNVVSFVPFLAFLYLSRAFNYISPYLRILWFFVSFLFPPHFSISLTYIPLYFFPFFIGIPNIAQEPALNTPYVGSVGALSSGLLAIPVTATCQKLMVEVELEAYYNTRLYPLPLLPPPSSFLWISRTFQKTVNRKFVLLHSSAALPYLVPKKAE